jgi:hypothetical protein
MSRVGSLWLLAVSIGAFFCFCVGSGMLISGSTAAPFRRPAIANQSIPPLDRPRVPLYWCQVLQRVVIRSGRRSKCRCFARFHTPGRGRRQCPPILTHRATAMIASVLLSHGCRVLCSTGWPSQYSHGITIDALGAVEILVARRDTENARALLASAEAGEFRLDDERGVMTIRSGQPSRLRSDTGTRVCDVGGPLMI